MAEGAAARRSPAGNTRTPVRRTTANVRSVAPKSTKAAPSASPKALRVSSLSILRRMAQRALKREQTAPVVANGPRENRRRSTPVASPTLRDRWSGVSSRLERPLEIARRVGYVMLRGALMLAIAVGVVAVGRLVEAHVRKSPTFATKTIEIEGNERLERDAVLAAATLAIGKNAFEVSPEEAERALLKQPWIATAHVTRRLPDSYAITIEERQAVALLMLERPYLVAGDAAVFKEWQPGDPEELPVITGADAAAFANDRVYRTTLLVNAVALLHDYRDVGLWRRVPIQEIHVESDEGMTLYVGQSATAVRLHKPPFRKKLGRLRKVLDQLAAKHAEPAYVYLDNVRREDRVTVRLR